MRNAGDLKAASDLHPGFQEEGRAIAQALSLAQTAAAFSRSPEALERDYFTLFDSLVDEIRGE